MRYVFIDSNIIYNNWYLASSNFLLLANLIKNSSTTLLVSEIVCQEVQNLYVKGLSEAVAQSKKSHKNLEKFFHEKNEFVSPVNSYDFKDILNSRFEAFIEFVGFANISNQIVVERAIKQKLPFRQNEKGYRDTLIWLSLLENLSQKNESDEVIFISENIDDFYLKNETRFHDDLQADLIAGNIKCSIKPFLTLPDFLETIKLEEEAFSTEKVSEYVNEIEREITYATEEYLSDLSTSEFKDIVRTSRSYFFLPYVSNHNFEIDEGIEDPDVLTYKKISADSIYIACRFNLRRVFITFVIPHAEYIRERERFKRFEQFSYLAEDEYYVVILQRPDLIINFIYNFESGAISGFELQSFNLRVEYPFA